MLFRKLLCLSLLCGVNLSFANDSNKLPDIKIRYTEPSSVIRPKDCRQLARVLAGSLVGIGDLTDFETCDLITTLGLGTLGFGLSLFFAPPYKNNKSYVKQYLIGGCEGALIASLPIISRKLGKEGNINGVKSFLRANKIDDNNLDDIIIAFNRAQCPVTILSGAFIGMAVFQTGKKLLTCSDPQ